MPAKPRPISCFDFATLTGAARVALGPEIPPFYTGDDGLAADIAAKAAAANDPAWRMPLWDSYDSGLDGKISDLVNVTSGPFAGSITAALFLRRFVADPRRWAHFDVYCWNPLDEARPSGRRRDAGCASPLRFDRGARRTRESAFVSESFDRRLTPARPEIAAAYLKGRVTADRYVEGVVMEVRDCVVDLRREPRPDAAVDTQALYGERITVYDEEEGWAWAQLARDNYVGWIAANTFGAN